MNHLVHAAIRLIERMSLRQTPRYVARKETKKEQTELVLENGQLGVRDGYGVTTLTLKHSDCYTMYPLSFN